MIPEAKKDGESIRNNPLRIYAKKIIRPVLPMFTGLKLCADDLSAISIALAADGSNIARKITPFEANPGTRSGAAAKLLLAAAFDGVDGELSRYQEDLGIIRRRFPWISGEKVDALSDRIQETLMGLSRIDQAFRRKNLYAVTAAIASTLTNPLASSVRSYAEWKGVSVGEKPKGFVAKAGDRTGRALVGIPSTVSPEFQPIGDSLVAAGNIKNAADRWYCFQERKEKGCSLSPATRQNGKERFFINLGYAVLNTAVITAFAVKRYRQEYGGK